MADATTEERQTAANYILTFYNDVLSFTHWKTNYKNFIIELREKYGAEGIAKRDDAESAALKEIMFQVRYFADKTAIMYQAIMKNLSLNNEAEFKRFTAMKEAMARIDAQYLPGLADLDVLLVNLHDFLLNEVVKGVLRTSQDVVTGVYGK